ncbi:histidine ammonia-lyase [Caldalkalibacillus salinus]|uniref:histidine ammonia-lyase n=1 Tax=Caldalkalibacillus salinus TaxID=2803787 RepID=UPI001921D850|nr:histidine ammonia-lyase [Caldalkalibacillus salinus]
MVEERNERVTLDGYSLTLDEIHRVVMKGEKVAVKDEAWFRVRESHQTVQDIVEQNQVVYGITTGFGKLSDVYIHKHEVEALQTNLIRSHACGVGAPFDEKVSRTILLLRANALVKGYSGVRPEVISFLVQLLNEHIHPVIPQQGSLGASGDLAPLSHMALVVMGEGEVYKEGHIVSSQDIFQQKQITPLRLQAKEGLALINGTQVMTAVGVLNLLNAETVALQADLIASMTIEGLRGVIDAFDDRIHLARGYQEQRTVAKRLRHCLQHSQLVTRQGELRVQDAYSLRCIPQVHGATWQTLQYVRDKLEVEINAATDNPLVFAEADDVLSGGNFHGQPMALAMDFLAIAMAEMANISERRIERLVNPQLNDLPAFLSPEPGLQSGAMILQYCAASLVSENKTLAHPASVDSIPSSANQEDHVSMGTIGARHATQVIDNVRRVLAIELFCALQAVEYRGPERLAPVTSAFYTLGREQVKSLNQDRATAQDIEHLAAWLQDTFNPSEAPYELTLDPSQNKSVMN